MSDTTERWTAEQWEAWRANNRRLLDEGYVLDTNIFLDGSVECWATRGDERIRRDPKWDTNFITTKPRIILRVEQTIDGRIAMVEREIDYEIWKRIPHEQKCTPLGYDVMEMLKEIDNGLIPLR